MWRGTKLVLHLLCYTLIFREQKAGLPIFGAKGFLRLDSKLNNVAIWRMNNVTFEGQRVHYVLSPLICTIVININCNIVVCTYRKLTAPELEGKEIQWQRTALFFPSPPPWIIEGMSSPKSTNFLQFPLTAVNCLWSLTSSNGAWDDSVPQIQTSFALNILHFLVFLRGKLFYTSHCSFTLLQYSTVTIYATFRGTTVKTAVNINLGSVIYICHWKKNPFLSSFSSFALKFCII